jgi:septal ring factor EnvC (AmiA/AmiB activator)
MNVNSIAELLKSHDEFVQKIQNDMAKLNPKQANPEKVAVREKDKILAQLKQQRETISAAKETLLRRYDREINQYNEAITRLEQEIKASSTKTNPDSSK